MNNYPNPLDFPKSLNPFAADAWFQACLSTGAAKLTSKEAWVIVLEKFINLCQAQGLDPFFKGDANSAIRQYLFKRRSQFVLFLDRTKFLRGLKPILNVKHEVTITDYGFEIRVSGQYRVQDASWFKQVFRFPIPYRFSRLRKNDKTFYSVSWEPGLEVFIANDQINSLNQWHIGYILRCPIHPDAEGQNLKDFIFNSLWKPIASSKRPYKVPVIRSI